ncbi:fibroblast growth factor receptor-like [Planococcus citri]|uniref:fibroblast growth factor receptor-like n=1 Tax=Planococcus citri TaxID=170843 RepID=UPI0031F8C10E
MVLILLLLMSCAKFHEVTMESNEGALVMFIDPGFTCNDGTRIRGRQFCNEITDCSENEDEDVCLYTASNNENDGGVDCENATLLFDQREYFFQETYECKEGAVVELACPVCGTESNNAKIKWLKNNLLPDKWPNSTHREFKDTDFQLKINECNMADKVFYTCTVYKKGTKRISYNFLLHVQKRLLPTKFITEKPQNKTVKLGDSWSFKCPLANPSLEIHFYRKVNLLTTKYTTDMPEADNMVNKAGELHISHVSVDDEGWYSCRVLNPDSQDAAASAYLKVTT